MIYLRNTSATQMVYVPKNGTIMDGLFPAGLTWSPAGEVPGIDPVFAIVAGDETIILTLQELTFFWMDATKRWMLFWIPGGRPPDPLTLTDREGEYEPVVIPEFTLDHPQPIDLGFKMRIEPGQLVFKVRSTIDLDEVVSQEVTDLRTSELYFNFAVSLPANLPVGEYEYTLLSGQIPVSSGLLVIGDYTKPSEYNKEIQYEQYETER